LEGLFGHEHPFVAQIINDTAWILFKKGKYKECEEMYREALLIREKCLGNGTTSLSL
jgi:hypothetical protein